MMGGQKKLTNKSFKPTDDIHNLIDKVRTVGLTLNLIFRNIEDQKEQSEKEKKSISRIRHPIRRHQKSKEITRFENALQVVESIINDIYNASSIEELTKICVGIKEIASQKIFQSESANFIKAQLLEAHNQICNTIQQFQERTNDVNLYSSASSSSSSISRSSSSSSSIEQESLQSSLFSDLSRGSFLEYYKKTNDTQKSSKAAKKMEKEKESVKFELSALVQALQKISTMLVESLSPNSNFTEWAQAMLCDEEKQKLLQIGTLLFDELSNIYAMGTEYYTVPAMIEFGDALKNLSDNPHHFNTLLHRKEYEKIRETYQENIEFLKEIGDKFQQHMVLEPTLKMGL